MDFLKDLSLDKVRNLAEDAFNQAKPKTDLEAKVYEILSHKNWGASSTLMNEIARDTFDYDKFAVITQLMWEAMENQRPAAWRIVFKGLTMLEHLIKNGSERCVDDARNHGHSLRALNQFNYYEGTIDRGSGVREKSKQIIEMLADDDRIREERQRARKLREKFGSTGGGVGGGGGGGGGGGQYAGYGNDNWESTGASGGYGDGGIGSKTAGRYDEDRGRSSGGGYSGRYDNDESTKSTPAVSAPVPTFASIPAKAKSKKKKAPAVASAAPSEPVVDLFSFDNSAPAPAGDDDDFDNFQSAGGPSSSVADPFAAPAPQAFAAPTQQAFAAPSQQFDAFGGAPVAPVQQQQFDAFGGSNANQSQFGGFVAAPMGMNTGMMPGNVMGGNSMMQGHGNAMGMTGGSQMKQSQVQNEDDDFGDFAGAAPSNGAASGPSSSNPISKLISLDGLSKNTNKLEDKLNQPIIANAAAATFVQEKEHIQAAVKQSNKGSSMSFAGIDGLHKSSMGGGMGMNQMMPPAMSMGMNPSVMGSGGGSSSLIGMLDPNEMMAKKPTPQMMPQNMTGQQMPGAMNPQMGGMMNPQMGGMMNPQMGGMMNPQMGGMNPQMGGMNPQMGGMNPQMGGMNPQMGGMNPQMGGMNPQMMGFGGMPQANQGMTMGMNSPNMMQGFGQGDQNMNGFGGTQQGMGQQNNSMGGGMGGFR